MTRSERTSTIERAAVAEAMTSLLSHDMRNKLATIRNAVFYLRRQLAGSAPWESDSRVPLFFELIESEIEAAEVLLRDRAQLDGVFRSEAVAVGRVVREALERTPLEPVDLDIDEAVTINADPHHAALAVECILWNAAEALAGASSPVCVRVARSPEGAALVEVRNEGAAMEGISAGEAMRELTTTKAGRIGMGLALARRFALRHRGSLSLAREGEWTVARLVVPSTESSE